VSHQAQIAPTQYVEETDQAIEQGRDDKRLLVVDLTALAMRSVRTGASLRP
jgi:hypothetical protein